MGGEIKSGVALRLPPHSKVVLRGGNLFAFAYNRIFPAAQRDRTLFNDWCFSTIGVSDETINGNP
jgi:hypothetical protein